MVNFSLCINNSYIFYLMFVQLWNEKSPSITLPQKIFQYGKQVSG